jgi:AraC family transcriptional activator of pobA
LDFKHYEIVQIRTSKEARSLDFHRHSYYELFLFMAGSGSHNIDFKSFDINPHTMQLVAPLQLHQVKHSKDSEGYVLKVQPLFIASNAILSNYFNYIKYNQHFKAGVEISKQESQLLQSSYTFLMSYDNNNANDSLFGMLSTLHLYISILKKHQNMDNSAESNPHNIYFTQFLSLAEKHYLIEKNADYYSQKMTTPLRKLNNIVKDRTGLSVKQFLIQRVLLESKRLIIHSNKSVKEIAYELDFLEPAHFSNFFKKHIGLTPTKFRANSLV